MTRAAPCQCAGCLRYLVRDRDPTSPQLCASCAAPEVGIPLARIRGPESLSPTQVEGLSLVAEECAEVVQRVTKTLRWGADCEWGGRSMSQLTESECGDVLAVLAVAIHNGLLTSEGIARAARRKLEQFREDRAGPAQRTRHVALPSVAEVEAMCVIAPEPPLVSRTKSTDVPVPDPDAYEDGVPRAVSDPLASRTRTGERYRDYGTPSRSRVDQYCRTCKYNLMVCTCASSEGVDD